MSIDRPIHPHFQHFLDFKDKLLIDLYIDLRNYIFTLHPEVNELVYNTHALGSGYSLSDRLSETYCAIIIYTKHMNLAFPKGALLEDKNALLKGTGKRMRHIPIASKKDYRNEEVKTLIHSALQYDLKEMDIERKKVGLTISKIKISK